MTKSKLLFTGSALAVLALVFITLYQIPSLHSRINWRIDTSLTYLRILLNPAGAMPTPLASLAQPRLTYKHLPTPTPGPTAIPALAEDPPAATPLPTATPTPTPTLAPIPASAEVPPPAHEKQDANNCGPATLTMYLRSYGWKGDQYKIATLIKPDTNDRNVNVDELLYFVQTQVGWLNAEYRVGGTLDELKRFIAAGMPIMIEEESLIEKQYWPGDDLWAGHYLLLTAYDEAKGVFTSQDSWLGPNLKVTYSELDRRWQTFNRVYIMVYRPDQEDAVKEIVGANWDEKTSRANALKTAQLEAQANPQNAFAWFNMGTNLDYFERYTEAAQAFDTARQVRLPQRMLRYQFGPFIAYFRSGRIDDLKALAEYALKITPNSEEDLLWYAWALYMKGDKVTALDNVKKALKVDPGYLDAQYALTFMSK